MEQEELMITQWPAKFLQRAYEEGLKAIFFADERSSTNKNPSHLKEELRHSNNIELNFLLLQLSAAGCVRINYTATITNKGEASTKHTYTSNFFVQKQFWK